MNKKYYIIQLVFSFFALWGCDSTDVEEIVPTSISNVIATPGAGVIDLKWQIPEGANYKMLEVTYFDYLIEKDVVRLASVYADSMHIPNTRAKFGDYVFKIQPISETKTRGEAVTVTSQSGKATKTKNWISKGEQIKLSEAALSSNAKEPSEGSLLGLIDGKNETFFHSAWSISVPGPHFITIDLGEPIEAFMIETVNRNNGGTANRPKTVEILGSLDGETFKLIKTLTNLPNATSAVYVSGGIVVEGDLFPRYIRYSVKECSSGAPAFNLAELTIFKGNITVIDPEAE